MKINHFDDADLSQLRTIRARLYDDKPLTGDQRRDLANKLDAILRHVETADIEPSSQVVDERVGDYEKPGRR